jgi:hypothetical protein
VELCWLFWAGNLLLLALQAVSNIWLLQVVALDLVMAVVAVVVVVY